MENSFRKSMAWLHTWTGVVIGSVLFAIFWMGTLSVFDKEIDRWMQPGTRIVAPATTSLDEAIMPIVNALTGKATQISVTLPNDRIAHLRVIYRDAHGNTERRAVDPSTHRLIPDQGSLSGSGFFFPFHFSLNLKWSSIGYWLVGLAGMAMLVLLVSGVIIHKRIFADFFLFRPKKQLQRASLDLHNVTGVLGLPFHFFITLSGLIIFYQVYFPLAHEGIYGQGKVAQTTFQKEATGRYVRPKADIPAQTASLDSMVAEAERQWSNGKAQFVRVWHPGDAASYVEVRRSVADEVTMNLDQMYFDAPSGALLDKFETPPIVTGQRFIAGMHFIQFKHWGLRWLYFLAGLSGCIMIATGFLFWLESRRASHIKNNRLGVRIVEALTIGSVTGILIATATYLVINRLLPLGTSFATQDRAQLEVWSFYIVWLLTLAHAAWRRADPVTQPARRAWSEQCWVFSLMALLGLVLNSATTGDHLFATMMRADWQVAGVDLMLLVVAGSSAWVANRLGRKQVGKFTSNHPAEERRKKPLLEKESAHD